MPRPSIRSLTVVLVLAVGLGAVEAAPASSASTKLKVTYARIVQAAGAPHLVVQVTGPDGRVRIRVTQFGPSKRVLRVAVRTIRTNRRVRVPRLTITPNTANIQVRIVRRVG